MERRYWLLTTVAFLCATTFLYPGGARVTEAAAIVRIADVNRLKLIPEYLHGRGPTFAQEDGASDERGRAGKNLFRKSRKQ